MRDLTGRTAVVTGAGSGIGRALAMAFAAEGCRLALVDIDPMGLEETRRLPDILKAGWRRRSWPPGSSGR